MVKNLSSVPDERNRKQKKLRYIRVKNLMRKYPECTYGGDFYCNHVYDPAYPWNWIDFRFFHSKLRRYYAASLRTLDFVAYDELEWKAYELAAEALPFDV